MPSNQIHCPACKSKNVEAKEKGFDHESGTIGSMLFGGVGMVVAGYKDRKMVMIHCLDCKVQSNHTKAMGVEYKTFKKEFYILYNRKEYVQAEQLYRIHSEEDPVQEEVHELYAKMRADDQKSTFIAICFALFAITLLIAFFVFDIH